VGLTSCPGTTRLLLPSSSEFSASSAEHSSGASSTVAWYGFTEMKSGASLYSDRGVDTVLDGQVESVGVGG